MAYYIYHIVGVKIGCTKNLKHRIKSQGFTEYEILEEHTDINLASDRERELQRKYGYQVDNGTNVYSGRFSKMGKIGGGKNSIKQKKWRVEFKDIVSKKAIDNVNSGKWRELQKKAWEKAGEVSIKNGRWDIVRKKGTEACKKPILVFDKSNNFIKEFESITAASIELGMGLSTVANAVKGIVSSKKYNFKYK
jgi:hypothetical protein